MQVKCILFPLDWVINKSYSFKSEWKETVEKKDLLGAEGGRPDLILSPTFSFSWSKPSIGDQLRPWWILFNFVLQHKSIGTKTVYQMETFQSLSFHRNQKWKQLNTPDIRRRDRATKLHEYFATQLNKLLDVWSFFFFFPLSTWADSLPSHKFQGFSLAVERPLNSTPFPNQCQASGLHHIAGGPLSAFIFTSPFLNNNSKFGIIFEDSIGIKTNITQAGFHYYIFIIIFTQNLNILLDP